MKDALHDILAACVVFFLYHHYALATPPAIHLEAGEKLYAPCLVGKTVKEFADGSKTVQWRHIEPCDAKPPQRLKLSETEAGKNLNRAAAADVASTAMAIGVAGASELNPLGLAATLTSKAWLVAQANSAEDSANKQTTANKWAAMQWGATVNNLCLLVPGATIACPLLGVGVGVVGWPTKEKP